MTLGSRIRSARQRMGLNQKEAAQLLGVSNVVLNRYESGERSPDASMIPRIAVAFSVSTDELLSGALPATDESYHQPWMDKLAPQTLAKLEELGGMRPFHTGFLGGTTLNDLGQHDLEIIMQVYFRHREESDRKRKPKESHNSDDSK